MGKNEISVQTSGREATAIREKLYNTFFSEIENSRTGHSGGTGGEVSKIQELTENVYSCMNASKSAFVGMGYWLYRLYKERIGWNAQEAFLKDIGMRYADDYAGYLAYVEKYFGFKRSSVYNYIGVALRYCKLDDAGNPLPELADEFKEYGYSQLVEMQSIPKLLPPGLTIKEIREKKAEYQAEQLEKEKTRVRKEYAKATPYWDNSKAVPACDLQVGDVFCLGNHNRRPIVNIEKRGGSLIVHCKPQRNWADPQEKLSLFERAHISTVPFEPGKYEIEDTPFYEGSPMLTPSLPVKTFIAYKEPPYNNCEYVPVEEINIGDYLVCDNNQWIQVVTEKGLCNDNKYRLVREYLNYCYYDGKHEKTYKPGHLLLRSTLQRFVIEAYGITGLSEDLFRAFSNDGATEYNLTLEQILPIARKTKERLSDCGPGTRGHNDCERLKKYFADYDRESAAEPAADGSVQTSGRKYTYDDFIGMNKIDLCDIIIAISEGYPIAAAIGKTRAAVSERREQNIAALRVETSKAADVPAPESADVIDGQTEMKLSEAG